MTETKDLTVLVEQSGLEKSKANYLLENFQDYFAIAADWETKSKAIIVTDETQLAEMKMAREGRLFLREKRIAVEKARKQLKDQSLREGRAIDGIANVLKALIVPIEEYLDDQEHFIERKREREAELRRAEAEKALREKEERERKEAEAEARRVEAENAQLKKEAEEREAEIRAEREAAEKKHAAEREAAERKLAAERAKAEKERKAAEQIAAEERKAAAEKAAKLEKKLKLERERKAVAQKKAAAEKAAREDAEREAAAALERREKTKTTCPKCGHVFYRDDF